MPRVLLSLSLLVVSLLSTGCRPDPVAMAKRQIKQLGGTLRYDKNSYSKTLIGVDLRDTKTSDDDLDFLAKLPDTVTDLNLSNTQITDESMSRVAALQHLRWISVARTKITDDGLKQIAKLKNIRELGVGPQTTDAGLAHLASLRDLHTLYLGGSRIDGSGIPQLKSVTSLTNLWLDETAVTDDNLRHLRHLPQLQRLVLSSTPITDAGLTHLTSLKELDYLSLADTAITDEAVDKRISARARAKAGSRGASWQALSSSASASVSWI